MLYVCIAPCTIRVSPMIIAIFADLRYSVMRPSGRIRSVSATWKTVGEIQRDKKREREGERQR